MDNTGPPKTGMNPRPRKKNQHKTKQNNKNKNNIRQVTKRSGLHNTDLGAWRQIIIVQHVQYLSYYLRAEVISRYTDNIGEQVKNRLSRWATQTPSNTEEGVNYSDTDNIGEQVKNILNRWATQTLSKLERVKLKRQRQHRWTSQEQTKKYDQQGPHTQLKMGEPKKYRQHLWTSQEQAKTMSNMDPIIISRDDEFKSQTTLVN